jgi:predicted pyridoxine 5'-phosphate oxidase superfamily flavin-nucleotide-binding protein
MQKRMAEIGPRVLHTSLPEQHQIFLSSLPFIVLGAVDPAGYPWASMLFGTPGFIAAHDKKIVHIGARPDPGDTLTQAVVADRNLALLGIDYPTRRRSRVNGTIEAVYGTLWEGGFSLRVVQAFGNCHKYIPPHNWPTPNDALARRPWAETLPQLNGSAWAVIEAADTFFLATASAPEGSPDVSHRGGSPGFLRRTMAGDILLPDYPGNFYFNSIGNVISWPLVGLVFADLQRGALLQITGTAEIIWDGPLVAQLPNALRALRITPGRAQWLHDATPVVKSSPAIAAQPHDRE